MRGVDAELHMIGDKIHDDPDDPASPPACAPRWRPQGVVWHGGHPRAEAMRLTAGCDVGLSWRDPDMDASLELSTKVLECGTLGVPVVLNRTPMHERLLGADYPLFAATEADVLDALTSIGKNPDVLDARRGTLPGGRRRLHAGRRGGPLRRGSSGPSRHPSEAVLR